MEENEKKPSYIKERIDQYYNWYDAKAVKSKKIYQLSRTMQALVAILIPVIVNIKIQIFFIDSTVIVSILGILVAVSVSMENVFHYREQWLNSRTTAEYLKTQKILFQHRAKDYAELEDKQAFKQLVERIENAIAEENAVTLSVLSRSEQNNHTTQ